MYDGLVAIVLVLVVSIAALFMGKHFGETHRQELIVEECSTNGMYIDRNLFMVCQVGTPKVVPKPPTL
jgi:hypothetical protein